MSVTTCVRGFVRAVGLAAGAFGSSTFWNFSVCSDTLAMVPAPSMRNSAGAAPAPCPRMTDT